MTDEIETKTVFVSKEALTDLIETNIQISGFLMGLMVCFTKERDMALSKTCDDFIVDIFEKIDAVRESMT